MARPVHYWLMKSEPEVYSIDDLKRDKHTLWTGVRNYQARNSMMGEAGLKELAKIQKPAKKTAGALVTPKPPTMEEGDRFLFYHSNAEPPACVGVGRIDKVGQVDPEQFDKKSEMFEPKATKIKPMWYCADVSFQEKFRTPVPLEEIRADKALSKMVLLQKGSRLSVQPVTRAEFEHILKLGSK